MSYAALADLKQRLGTQASPPGLYEQLTDRINAAVADDAVGAEILAAAHGEIDGWLAKRYAVPIDVTTDVTLAGRLKGITLDVAEYSAWKTSSARTAIPARVRDNYAAAVKWLTAVAEGDAALPGATEVPGATATGAGGTAVGHARVFTEDAMEGW